MSAIIADWPVEQVRGFPKRVIQFQHNLHQRPMFSDEGLAEILDRYPRHRMGVFTMGEDLRDWRSWRRGSAEGLDGDQLLEAVQSGRLWLNLRHANRYMAEFADLCDEIGAEKEAAFRTKVLNRDLGLLISSPKAQVFYHLDVPLSSLWQVRGEKTIRFYPLAEPYVDPAWLERCAQGTAEGQLPFRPEWDDVAETLTLAPGDMCTWGQNVPHRVDNGSMLNVSVSMEYMTPQARWRANVLHANGVLRDHLGVKPKIQAGPGPRMGVKLALALAHKTIVHHHERKPVLDETFALPAPRMV